MTKNIGIAVAITIALVTACVPAARGAHPPTRQAEELTLDLGNSVAMKLVKIPAGKFTMGVPAGAAYRLKTDEDEHEVTIAKEFWMGATEVSQAQYETIMGDNPTTINKQPQYTQVVDPQCPVVRVSLNQAKEFCKKLSAQSGKTVRLPTEQEWEYAARAGGDGLGGAKVPDVAWFKDNSENKQHPVGTKAPNAWGLYDMLGNVGEWATSAKGAWIRGGSLADKEESCRPTRREPHGGLHNDPRSGFRVVVDIQASSPAKQPDAIIVGPEVMAQSRGCSGKLVDDPKASTGKALHFRADGISSTPLGKLDLKPGRYRFTVYSRHESCKKFKLRLRIGGANFDNSYTFFFGADPKGESYQAQSVEWIVPGPGTGGLEGAKFQSGEMVDRVVITPVAAASLLEVLDDQ
jgi:formylglycine-generating enzyme required for sulfatase activity